MNLRKGPKDPYLHSLVIKRNCLTSQDVSVYAEERLQTVRDYNSGNSV